MSPALAPVPVRQRGWKPFVGMTGWFVVDCYFVVVVVVVAAAAWWSFCGGSPSRNW